MSDDRRIAMRLTKIENTLDEIRRTITGPEPPDRMITVNEAAEIMRCPAQRVRDSIRDGTLKGERNGRRYYLSLHDVMARAGYRTLEKNGAPDSFTIKRQSDDYTGNQGYGLKVPQ